MIRTLIGYKQLLSLFMALITGLIPPTLFAASCSASSNVLAFGTYDVFRNSPTDSTGVVQVTCSPGTTTYSISLDNGRHGTILNRKMRGGNGNDTLNYNLYTDATFSTVWGDGAGNGVTVPGTRPTRFIVYGRIPPLQDVYVGDYTDQITVTVNF